MWQVSCMETGMLATQLTWYTEQAFLHINSLVVRTPELEAEPALSSGLNIPLLLSVCQILSKTMGTQSNPVNKKTTLSPWKLEVQDKGKVTKQRIPQQSML